MTALINLGCALLRQDRLPEAEQLFRSALEVDPCRMDAQLFLAECLLNKRDLVNIQKVLDEANRPGAMSGRYAALQPHHAQLWAIFSTVLFEAQNYGEAERACHTALQIDPRNFMAKSNIGSIRMAQGRLGEAEALLRQLVSEHPREVLARLLLITCLARAGDLEHTRQEIERAIQREPHSLDVHKSVVGTYYNLGSWADYTAEIERFRGVDPASAHPVWEQSLVDLLHGDMPRGWELYEARLRLPVESKSQRKFAQPSWQGGSFVGKTLLLWAEQGLGDTLMFIRYLPLVKALGGRIILETPRDLMDVAATCRGADTIIPAGGPWPSFDLQASLMSLPWLFRTELSSIPAAVPYLDVPGTVPHRPALLECLTMAPEGAKIGLVWAGRPGYGRDFERSLSAASLAPLAALPGVTWFSFQLGRQELPPMPNLVTLAPFLKNFSDTAYALSGMDLLITVDTAVAHLAGALGIPTFLLLPFQPDFRWLLGRDDSPWYPSLRLYRQPAYGEWESVIRNVIADLTQEA
jgi:tetratricopeptide (TPR) repeat protein